MSTYASPQAYREAAVLTASPVQLVVMLYDGVERFLRQAEVVMAEGNVTQTHDRMQRAEAIIDELIATLDHSAGDIADRLNALYLYSRRTLGEARIERNPEKIDHVDKIIAELRDAWAQICGGDLVTE